MSTEQKPPTKPFQQEVWRFHDIYENIVSFGRAVTRSQTAFSRVKNSDSDMELFSEGQFHHPKSKAHLIATMKGKYGAIPRTKITRSTSKHLKLSKKLCEELHSYKLELRRKKVIMELEDTFKTQERQKYVDEINETDDYYRAQIQKRNSLVSIQEKEKSLKKSESVEEKEKSEKKSESVEEKEKSDKKSESVEEKEKKMQRNLKKQELETNGSPEINLK